jgi:beta-glucosidase
MHLKYKFNRQRPIDMNFANRSGEGLSDMGWEIYSEGLWKVIQLVHQTGKPFYITENGIADANDILRLAYLKNHLRIIQRAREKELPLKGYYYWSLLDNYEWLVGKQAKFGLFEVDFNESYQRRLRDSGSFYADYILNQTDQ